MVSQCSFSVLCEPFFLIGMIEGAQLRHPSLPQVNFLLQSCPFSKTKFHWTFKSEKFLSFPIFNIFHLIYLIIGCSSTALHCLLMLYKVAQKQRMQSIETKFCLVIFFKILQKHLQMNNSSFKLAFQAGTFPKVFLCLLRHASSWHLLSLCSTWCSQSLSVSNHSSSLMI